MSKKFSDNCFDVLIAVTIFGGTWVALYYILRIVFLFVEAVK